MVLSNMSGIDRLRRYLSQIMDSIREFERISEPTAIRIAQDEVPASFEIIRMPEYDGPRHEFMMQTRNKILEFLTEEKVRVEEAIKKL